METFYLIVLAIAIILLIIILAYIGIYGMKSNNISAYPPVKYDCPDYWKKDENDACVIPSDGSPNMGAFNGGDLTPDLENIIGIIDNTAIDFNDAGWSATGSSRCSQKKWAIDNNIVWDTVTNYNQC
tara:strand:- start:2330 stop:2710 length:381 start_codon:yes stop_codon:yes gene_type:complete